MADKSRGPSCEPPICDYEGSAYRTDFWEGQGRDYEDLVERAALKRLLPVTGRRLLDVGAGFGRLADMYAGYEQVVLLDYSQSQLEYARGRLGDERFVYVASNIYKIPLASGAVDTAVMVRVLHHIAQVPLVLAQLGRVIRPGGALVLEFANKRHAKNILRHLLGRGVNPFDPTPYEFAELHFDFHPRWVNERLTDAGLEVERRLSVSLFRSPLLKRILPTSLLVEMDRRLQRLTAPLALGPSAFVLARRRGTSAAGEPVGSDALFRCPECGHEPLVRRGSKIACQACAREWPVENGVYVFK